MLRPAHGAAAERGLPGPRVEVSSAAHLPDPVPAKGRSLGGRKRTTFVPGSSAAAAAGLASAMSKKATRTALSLSIVSPGINDSPAFAAYRRKAASLRRAYCRELATLAGGMCGAGPSAMAAAGAAEYAASRFVFDQAAQTLSRDDFALASKLAAAARQHFLAAYELAVRQAKAIPRDDLPDADKLMADAEAKAVGRRQRTMTVESG